MILTFWEVVGTLGSALLIAAYFANQQGWVKSNKLLYLSCNLVGSLLITASLFVNWNLPSLVIEIFWILISLLGIARLALRMRAH